MESKAKAPRTRRKAKVRPTNYSCAMCNRRHGRWTKINKKHLQHARTGERVEANDL